MTARNLLNAKSEGELLDAQAKRYPHGGKDEITGEYCDQLYPFNDNICQGCAKKLTLKSEFLKTHISNADMVYQRGLCRLCGEYFMLPSYFVRVHLLLGRNSFKRISRLDQYGNTQDLRDRSRDITEKSANDTAKRF
jgi:hypothetical protein